MTAVRNLLLSRSAILALIGLAYAAVWRYRQCATPQRVFTVVFAALWLAWYLTVSSGFTRYAVPLIAVCSLFVAELGADLLSGGRTRRLIVAAVLAVFLSVSIGLRIRGVMSPPDERAEEFAAAVAAVVAPAVEPESIEWQLDILTERTFHHPYFPSIRPYDIPTGTEYLVEGPMSRSFGVYRPVLEHEPFERVLSIGEYELYRRVR